MSRALRLDLFRKRTNKYGVAPKSDRTLDGNTFASKGEMERYAELLLLQKAGEISGLKDQVTYSIDVNGVHVCKYIADFVYTEAGRLVVEDWKGFKTPAYHLKKRLMLAVHGIEIMESSKPRRHRPF